MIPELIQALAWSVFGLGFGFYFCHALKEVEEIREAVVHHNGGNGRGGPGGVGGVGGIGPGGGQGGTGGTGGKGGDATASELQQVQRDKSRKILGIFMMLLAVAIAVNAWYGTNQDRKATQREAARSRCQAEYNADMAKVLRLRAQWADEDKAAEIALFHSFLTAKPGAGRVLLENYLAVSERTDKLRDANPLPKLEDRGC